MSYQDLSLWESPDLSGMLSSPEEKEARIRGAALSEFMRFWDLIPESENALMHAMAIGDSGTGKSSLCLAALNNWYKKYKRTIVIIDIGKKGEAIEFGKLYGAENVLVHIPAWLVDNFSIRSRQRYTPVPYESAFDFLYNIQPNKINIDLGFQAYLDLCEQGKKKEFIRFVSEFNAVIRERFMDLYPATFYIEEAKSLIPARGHGVMDQQMALSNNISTFIQQARGFGFNLLAATQGFNLINSEARAQMAYKFFFHLRDRNAFADPYMSFKWFNFVNKRYVNKSRTKHDGRKGTELDFSHHFLFWKGWECYWTSAVIPKSALPFTPHPVGLKFYAKQETVKQGEDKGERYYTKYKQLGTKADVARHFGVSYGEADYWIKKYEREHPPTEATPSA